VSPTLTFWARKYTDDRLEDFLRRKEVIPGRLLNNLSGGGHRATLVITHHSSTSPEMSARLLTLPSNMTLAGRAPEFSEYRRAKQARVGPL
jgi:hypothetical protein